MSGVVVTSPHPSGLATVTWHDEVEDAAARVRALVRLERKVDVEYVVTEEEENR